MLTSEDKKRANSSGIGPVREIGIIPDWDLVNRFDRGAAALTASPSADFDR